MVKVPPNLIVSSSLCFDIEYLFYQVPVVFVNSFSSVSCDFGVFVSSSPYILLSCLPLELRLYP